MFKAAILAMVISPILYMVSDRLFYFLVIHYLPLSKLVDSIGELVRFIFVITKNEPVYLSLVASV